jgi:hypothetical protein
MSVPTTRTTLKATNARIDALDAKLDAILAALTGGQVAAPVEVPVLTVPTVEGVVTSVKDEPVGAKFGDLRTILKAHKAAGHIKAGVSVKEAIAQGLMDNYGNLADGTPPVVQVVVAETVTEAPAKPRTPAQKAAAERLAAAPRRADGTVTPESEWAAREALALTGKWDRFEIDALITEHGPDMILAAVAIA